ASPPPPTTRSASSHHPAAGFAAPPATPAVRVVLGRVQRPGAPFPYQSPDAPPAVRRLDAPLRQPATPSAVESTPPESDRGAQPFRHPLRAAPTLPIPSAGAPVELRPPRRELQCPLRHPSRPAIRRLHATAPAHTPSRHGHRHRP